jgi:predicted TIM-barrel fold metal-dependent hydrolase
MTRIIDAWVNADMSRTPTAWQKNAAESLFKKEAGSIFRKFSAQELLENMDEAGVETAILTLHADRPSKTLLAYAEQHPSRFAFSVLVDPRAGLTSLRQLDAVVRSHRTCLARVIPSLYNVPPDDRMYYPLYAKCAELELPISINTGLPAPGLPGRCQDPTCLDDVCRFFPELRIIMANGADPWWDVAISLMARHANLYLMTSAYAPRYLPASLIGFMSTRGQGKVMFATDFPFLGMQRCVKEAQQLPLGADTLEKYLRDNAMATLFPRSAPTLRSANAPESDAAALVDNAAHHL